MSQTLDDHSNTDGYWRSHAEAAAKALGERADDTRGQETGMRSSNKRSGEGARLVKIQRAVI